MKQEPVDFRETLYTIDKRGNRHWVYAALVKGRYFYRRAAVVYLLMAIYLAMPWITVGGQQAVLLNITDRRFVFFGSEFWATDTTYLFLVLAMLALSLFFFTSIIGRTWCGWACPETVFLEFLYRPIERLIEGSPAQRLKLDQSPWTFSKVRIKGTKLLIFAICSWILASTLLAYFVGREPLLAMMQGAPWEHPVPFVVTCALMGAMLFQFGWFREQFCTILCPYARFQSVLMDANSLTVGYDRLRGEPRGKLRAHHHEEQKPQGDCIDCGLCVRVCPTGIDIRNGLQLECIACTACIDACDSVMDQISRPRGLIRYATEHALARQPSSFLRPRVFVYSIILIALLTIFVYRLNHRLPLDVQLVRGPTDAPFTILVDGRVSNHLHAHLANKDKVPHQLTLEVVGDSRIAAVLPVTPFPVPPGGSVTVPTFFNFPPESLTNGKMRVTVIFRSDDGSLYRQEVTLLGPG